MKLNEKTLQKQWVVAFGAIFCCILWGSAFPCVKTGYKLFEIAGTDTAAQILFAGCRFTIAGIMAIMFASVMEGQFIYPTKKAIPKVVKICMLQTVAQYIFFYIGLANTTGVKSSIIGASNTFLSILIACLLVKQEKLTGQKLLGCILGFAGIIIINLTGSGIDMNFTLLGEGFMFFSAISYSLSSVILKEYSKEENPVMLSGYQFLVGGLILIAGGLVFGGRIETVSVKALILLLYMGFISAGAYSVWGILLKHNPVSKVSIYGFTTPVCGSLLSALILKEGGIFNIRSVIALVLVCTGIFTVNYVKKSE